MTVILDAV